MNSPEQTAALVASLTRTEAGRLTAVLTRIFGVHNLGMAEDVVQDVLVKALEYWGANGIPDNPAAWLFTAARNKALDTIRKNRRQQTFATDISTLLHSEYTTAVTIDDYFRDEEIQDNQLRMMFACCHPSINRESQLALMLKILCGFSVAQVARAFITTPANIEKRLYRAKQSFRENNISLEIPVGEALQPRLYIVLESIYLLFNEAHSASYHDTLVREDLAVDAIRLCNLLVTHKTTNLPAADALLALLYFHSARFAARIDEHGDLLLMKDQDRGLWDKDMIERGAWYLARASTGEDISRYHLEAAIAYEHCKAAHYDETDWQSILAFYDILKLIVPTPVVLLNRAIVIKELEGPAAALQCIREIPGIDYLQQYYLLHAILGELHLQMGQQENARGHFEKALKLAVLDAEKRLIALKLNGI